MYATAFAENYLILLGNVEKTLLGSGSGPNVLRPSNAMNRHEHNRIECKATCITKKIHTWRCAKGQGIWHWTL